MRTRPCSRPFTATAAALSLLLGGAAVAQVEPEVVVTVAGGNSGGPATAAWLNNTRGVTPDGSGGFYIADTANNRVRKVDSSGIISTVAGTGALGSAGDGGPATAARFQGPSSVVLHDGNLYIADMFNNRIRKVDPGGIITTVVGTGVAGFAGDGGPATAARLSRPTGIAFADDNLYIADTANNRIRRVDAQGNIATVVGTGVAGFSGDGGLAAAAQLNGPAGVALDGAGNIFIADSLNHRVRKVAAGAGTIATIAGTGVQGFAGNNVVGTAAQLNAPQGVACDGSGNVFIGDMSGRIRQVFPGGIMSTVAGGGTVVGDGSATAAQLLAPAGVAVDGPGRLLIAESMRIRRVILGGGTITTVAGGGTSGDGGPATLSSLNLPRGLAVHDDGTILIADTPNQRIRKVDPGGTITTIAGDGVGTFSGDGGPATKARLVLPSGVARDAAGSVYIADTLNHRIRKIGTDGVMTTVAGSVAVFGAFAGDGGPATAARLNGPTGVALDAAGTSFFIADAGNHRIRKVDPQGTITTVAGNGARAFAGDGGPATEASLSSPAFVAIDAEGSLFIADTGNQRVRKVDPQGTITTVAGNGVPTLSNPRGVALDGAGSLFIADSSNNCVRKMDAGGTLTTVTGICAPGLGGFSGEGGPATGAVLSGPSGVAVDAAGTLFIADTNNHRIRRLDVAASVHLCPAGELVAARLEIPTRNLADIDLATVTLQAIDPATSLPASDELPARPGSGVIGDANGNLVPDLTVELDRPPAELFPTRLRLAGRLAGGRRFSGDVFTATADIDATAPVVSASIAPLRSANDHDTDGRWYLVGYSASDDCDPSPAVAAVLVPDCAGASPVPVVDGQSIKLKLAATCEVKSKDGVLKISAPAITLQVTATDASGQTSVEETSIQAVR